MFHPRFALFALALLGIAPAVHAAPCTAEAEAQRVFAFQDKLAHAPAFDTEEVPPATQQTMLALQEALATAVTRTLQCEAATRADLAAIEADLARLLHANRPSLSAARKQQGMNSGDGKALAIAVQPLAGMSDTIAITASFTLGCGGDTILLLFHRQPDGWQRILNWHSNSYATIYDGFGDFFRYTVTLGAGGAKLIAVAHGTSGCAPDTGSFAVDLLAPATARAPQKLLDHHSGVYLFRKVDYGPGGADPDLISRADGFTLKLTVIAKGNVYGADDSYPGIFRYKTLANNLDRQPAANNARDFVAGWRDESWPTAARWSAQPPDPLHSAWVSLNDDKGPPIQFGPTRACTQTSQFQVQINRKVADSPARPLLYAKVLQGNGVFTLLALTPNPDPGCTGPVLIPKRRE